MNLDHVPEYFAKPGVTEALAAAHPMLLIRQMANEILRLRTLQPEAGSTTFHAVGWWDGRNKIALWETNQEPADGALLFRPLHPAALERSPEEKK